MRLRRTLLVTALAVVLFAACSSEGTPATTGSAAAPSTASSSSSSESSSSSSSAPTTQIALTAGTAGNEYSYTPSDPSALTAVPAGPVTVTMTNAGKEEHQATIIRLNDGVNAQQFATEAAADATGQAAFKLATGYGGPNAVAPSGINATTQVLDKPGSYLFICFIPGPDGVPHAAKGMVLPFTVTGESTETVSAPSTVVASEFAYLVPDKLKAGSIALQNAGQQTHEMAIYKLGDGKSLNDVKTFFGSQTPSGPPPFTPAGGFAAIQPGRTSTADVNLDKGSYVIMCFLPDTSGSGAPHFTKGMIQQVDVS